MKYPLVALPKALPLIFTAVTAAPELTTPCICPEVAVEAKLLTMLLFMFTVPAAPLLAIPALTPVVAVVAVIALPITEFPVILRVPGKDKFVIAVIPLVVEVLPPSTQF